MNPYIMAFTAIFLVVFFLLFFWGGSFLMWPMWARITSMSLVGLGMFLLLGLGDRYRG